MPQVQVVLSGLGVLVGDWAFVKPSDARRSMLRSRTCRGIREAIEIRMRGGIKGMSGSGVL